MAADHAVRRQRHTRAGDDAVDEGDHACGAGQERDDCAKPGLWRRVGFRPASTLGGKVDTVALAAVWSTKCSVTKADMNAVCHSDDDVSPSAILRVSRS
jgi:hypothetical protein